MSTIETECEKVEDYRNLDDIGKVLVRLEMIETHLDRLREVFEAMILMAKITDERLKRLEGFYAPKPPVDKAA